MEWSSPFAFDHRRLEVRLLALVCNSVPFPFVSDRASLGREPRALCELGLMSCKRLLALMKLRLTSIECSARRSTSAGPVVGTVVRFPRLSSSSVHSRGVIPVCCFACSR